MVRNSVANRLLNLLLLLMMTMLLSTQSVTSLEFESSPRVLVAASYPSIRIGPYDFRYFRVEVPRALAELSISLTRKWTGEHVGDKYEANVPMVCFRFGSPPLPDTIGLESPRESPEAAAIAAAKATTSVAPGECAWFHSNSSISLTNMQIVAGNWYVGVFSDPQPSRSASKMISRGNVYTFGMHFTVSGCKSPDLRGQNCSVAVKPLDSESPPKLGDETWLKSQHVGANEWKHFTLEVTDFTSKLQVRAIATRGNQEGHIYLKYGSLPQVSDNHTAIGSAPISVSMPRRGPWYIAVHNSNNNEDFEFDLSWLLEPFSHEAAINSMEESWVQRVLVEGARESPFNSFYGPTTRKEGVVSLQPWFSLSEMSHIGNTTTGGGGNWSYYFIDVPRGAAGAVLTVQLRHVAPQQATVSVYARLEGVATPEYHDAKIVNKESKLSLDLVYPAEGTWCIAVHYLKHVATTTTLEEDDTETSSRTARLSSSFVQWFHKHVKRFHSKYNSPASGTTAVATPNKEIGAGPPQNESGGPLVLSKRWDLQSIQMQITVHGCVNKCSGKGHCVTTYDASRLHFISFCGCDAAHGGVDCSVPLLVPRDEVLHVWALIGSNAAALLPSFWAIQHQAYSEWVSYVASGLSSGLYHSCDAGGWCVLSYDTLQFLDFWLSFVVVIMTCLSVASLKDDTKAVAHIAAAIITAAVTKENATSAWNVLLVVVMGLVGLLLGWALEAWRLHFIPSWLHLIGPIRPVLRLEALYRRGEQLLRVISARFHWLYLAAGVGLFCTAALSWVLETDDTYWIWHSLWHVSIFTSAYLILCSTSKSSWALMEENRQGYERTDLHPPSDLESVPILRHTVELDAFARGEDRSFDD